VLDLIGRGGSADAAVREPAGRDPRPAPRANRGASPWVSGRVREHLLQIEVLIELRELPLARLFQRLLERFAQQARDGLTAATAGRLIAARSLVAFLG
jgi:hypothetical protein